MATAAARGMKLKFTLDLEKAKTVDKDPSAKTSHPLVDALCQLLGAIKTAHGDTVTLLTTKTHRVLDPGMFYLPRRWTTIDFHHEFENAIYPNKKSWNVEMTVWYQSDVLKTFSQLGNRFAAAGRSFDDQGISMTDPGFLCSFRVNAYRRARALFA